MLLEQLVAWRGQGRVHINAMGYPVCEGHRAGLCRSEVALIITQWDWDLGTSASLWSESPRVVKHLAGG